MEPVQYIQICVEEVDKEGKLNDTSVYTYASESAIDFEGDKIYMKIMGGEYIENFGSVSEGGNK